MIGLLIGDVENPFYSAIASNVESVTRASGYNVVLCNSDDDAAIEREFLTLLQSMRVDGLIVTPTLKNRKHLIDRKVEGLEADAILIDNQGGARTAVEHIIAAGHSRIGMLSGDPDVSTAQERLAGFRKALADHGIAVDEDLIKPGSFHREHAIEDAIELVTATPAPTAILAANNLLAEAALIGIAESGLKVPDDISLVGFDSVPWMRVTNPPLTAVRQPVADMARSAAELLLRRLRGEGETTPNTVVFQADLVERASVAHLTPTKAVPH
jgi:LacI family transcriptional regulator